MNIPTYTSGILQVKAHRILQGRVTQILSAFHLNPTEWSILGLIFESKNGVRHAEIAKILNVETSLITMLVNGLVEKQLVERYGHPKDRRVKLLYLTQKARVLIPQVEKTLREALYSLLTGITKEDLDAYRRVLEAIVINETQ